MAYTRNIELLSAATSLTPMVVSYFFPVNCASMACILHCPFKCRYHIYNAFNANKYKSQIIYKRHRLFVHVGFMVLHYAWNNRIRFLYTFFNILALSVIRISKPLFDERDMVYINSFSMVGIFNSMIYVYNISKIQFVVSLYFYIYAFALNEDKTYNGFTDSIVNLMLVVPQYLLLANYNL